MYVCIFYRVPNKRDIGVGQGQATDMDGTLHIDLWESETSREIKNNFRINWTSSKHNSMFECVDQQGTYESYQTDCFDTSYKSALQSTSLADLKKKFGRF